MYEMGINMNDDTSVKSKILSDMNLLMSDKESTSNSRITLFFENFNFADQVRKAICSGLGYELNRNENYIIELSIDEEEVLRNNPEVKIN